MPELVTITPLHGVYSAALEIWVETTNLYYVMHYEAMNSGPPSSGIVTGELIDWGTETLNTGPAEAIITGIVTRTRLDLAATELLATLSPAVVPTGTLIKAMTPIALAPETVQTLGPALIPSGTLIRTKITMTADPETLTTTGPALTPTGTLV